MTEIKQRWKKKRRSPGGKKRHTNPRTADEFFAQTAADQETWNRMVRAIAKMRTEGLSLKKAAKEAGVTAKTVTDRGGRAIRKGKNGKYTVAKKDSLLRVLRLPTKEGIVELPLRNSKKASTVGQYWDTVQKYLGTGDSSGLAKFKGKRIKDANGSEFELITDLKELNRLGSAGVLSFESLYARAA